MTAIVDLFAILKSTDKLERAYVRDDISAKDYEPLCSKLIGQFKTLYETLRDEVSYIDVPTCCIFDVIVYCWSAFLLIFKASFCLWQICLWQIYASWQLQNRHNKPFKSLMDVDMQQWRVPYTACHVILTCCRDFCPEHQAEVMHIALCCIVISPSCLP